ncbi:MAG TPA: MlaD family protein [Caulobacteraceae bacterium]|jgi:phospholipid/cholesterol/gamma-HCH transport system substrate-binding protein
MERNANYALVGLISAVLFAGLVVFVVWLAGSGFSRELDTYDILFHGPVRGLSQGGEVHFNGIKVGDVSRIFLDPKNSTMVIAKVRITSDVPVRSDSVASLEPQGITGVNYIQISAGTQSKPLLKSVTPEGATPTIPASGDAFSGLLAGGGDIIQRALETLARVNRVLSDQNIKSLGDTVTNFKAVTDELRERKAIIADAQKAVQDADAAVVQVRDLAKSSDTLVNGDGKRTIAKLADAATEIEGAAKGVHGMVDNLSGPTSRFASEGLPQLSNAILSLQRASERMDEIAGEVRNDPRGLLNKPAAKQVEVKP